MTYTIRKAITSEAKPLVGLYSESGNGKTRSALLIAKGFCGDMSRVAMIETESGRGEAYADDPVVGGYGIISIREDFSPKSYGAAITAAEKAGVQCLIVDSASHEWESATGVLGMAAKAQEEGKKGPLVWQRAKMDHSREFMLRLTQTPIPLVVVCMRAKYTMEEKTRDGKKEWVRSTELSPKQSEDILYEMFIHGWIDKEHRFHGTKYTLDVLRTVFLDNQCITVDTGKRLHDWAAGASPSTTSMGGTAQTVERAGSPAHQPAAAKVPGHKGTDETGGTVNPSSPAAYITPEQVIDLETMCSDAGVSVDDLKAKAKIQRLAMLEASRFDGCVKWIAAQRAA